MPGLLGRLRGSSRLLPQALLYFCLGLRELVGPHTPSLCRRHWPGGERLSCRQAASINFCANSVPTLTSSLRAPCLTISALYLWEMYDTVSVKWVSHRQGGLSFA